MKVKLSVSMDETTLVELQGVLKESIFRNQSHLIEVATKKYLKEMKNGRS